MPDLQIGDNPDRERYEARLDGEIVGYASHTAEPGRLVILHVEVHPPHEGQGIGARIVEHVLDDARARSLEVVPQCSFAAAVMRGRATAS